MNSNDLDLSLLADRGVVRNDAITDVDLLVDIITTRAIGGEPSKQAINLCVVIDRSGSMSGEKLEQAKRSCVEIWESLTPQDTLTVLAFDTDVVNVANPQTPRAEVRNRIEALQPGGMTDLSKGWYLALLELQSYGNDRQVNRVILLSDGKANVGEQKSATLGAESMRARDELGISTSAIGIGDDFQEDILSALTRDSGGRFWYIGNNRITDIIHEEFSGALSVAVERPGIEIQLPLGVQVISELNDAPKSMGRYRLRPIKANDRFCLAVRVRTDPQQVVSGSLPIRAVLFDALEEIAISEATLSLGTIQEYADAPQDTRVSAFVTKYLAALADDEMMDKLDAGEISTVVDMLETHSDLLRDLEKKLAGQSALSWEDMTEQERMRAQRQLEEDQLELDRAFRALRKNSALRSVAILVELLQGLGAQQAVSQLVNLSRKQHMHRRDREMGQKGGGMDGVIDYESDRHMLRQARRVGIDVLDRYPAAGEEIRAIIRDIDEQLANLS